MAWFGLAKIALQAGGKLYANRQKTKMAMSDARLMHAERMARGEESYQGKLLEARQNDYKDEIVLAILTLPDNCARLVGVDRGSGSYEKNRDLFRVFLEFAKMVYEFMDTCSCQRFWYKGYTNI